MTYHVAISVPPWWYGKVQPSVLEPPNLESGAKLKVELIPEPVCCIAYFFSREKKHPLSVNSGNDRESLMYHCSMDDQYTVSRVFASYTTFEINFVDTPEDSDSRACPTRKLLSACIYRQGRDSWLEYR